MMTGAGWALGLGGWPWMILEAAVGIAIVVKQARNLLGISRPDQATLERNVQ